MSSVWMHAGCAGIDILFEQGAYVPASTLKLVCLQGCYRVVEVAQGLWHSPHPKAKDYIVRPKANGYQSLHLTLTVATAAAAASAAAVDGAALRSALEEDEALPSQQEGAVFLELQIRTQGEDSAHGCHNVGMLQWRCCSASGTGCLLLGLQGHMQSVGVTCRVTGQGCCCWGVGAVSFHMQG